VVSTAAAVVAAAAVVSELDDELLLPQAAANIDNPATTAPTRAMRVLCMCWFSPW